MLLGVFNGNLEHQHLVVFVLNVLLVDDQKRNQTLVVRAAAEEELIQHHILWH